MTGDPLVIAHRGASGRWAEHTRAAYLQAIDDGADGLECDVQLTADRVLVCWHDATVDRTSDGHGPLHAFTWAQLRSLDVASWKDGNLPDRYGPLPDQLLTFAELVRIALAADRPLVLAVELKHPEPVGFGPSRFDAENAALTVLRVAGWDQRTGRLGELAVSFMSFDPASLRHLSSAVPAESLMVLTGAAGADGELPAGDSSSALVDSGAVGGVGPAVAAVAAGSEAVRAWVAAGVRVRAWTVDDPAALDLCLLAGVQEVTTNYPARVRSLLAERARGRVPGHAGRGSTTRAQASSSPSSQPNVVAKNAAREPAADSARSWIPPGMRTTVTSGPSLRARAEIWRTSRTVS